MSRATAVVLAGVLAACSGVPATGIYLPTYETMNGVPAGELDGILVEDDGCLWIESDGTRWLVLWPSSARAVEANAGLVIRDGTGEAVVGEPIRLGGGEYGIEHRAFVADLIGEAIPPPCDEAGLFWLGYFDE